MIKLIQKESNAQEMLKIFKSRMPWLKPGLIRFDLSDELKTLDMEYHKALRCANTGFKRLKVILRYFTLYIQGK
jgi:hypothetical protein